MNPADAVMRVRRQWVVMRVIFTVPAVGCNCHALKRLVVCNLN